MTDVSVEEGGPASSLPPAPAPPALAPMPTQPFPRPPGGGELA